MSLSEIRNVVYVLQRGTRCLSHASFCSPLAVAVVYRLNWPRRRCRCRCCRRLFACHWRCFALFSALFPRWHPHPYDTPAVPPAVTSTALLCCSHFRIAVPLTSRRLLFFVLSSLFYCCRLCAAY
ncbi:hypothetical protein GGI42DRAFT_129733 [Trichoderma sp. SZMC 28013]